MVSDVVDMMIPLAASKSIRLETAIDPAAASSIAWMDRDRTTQLLTNLVSNAVKFTPDGGRSWCAPSASTTRCASPWATLPLHLDVALKDEAIREERILVRAEAEIGERLQHLDVTLWIERCADDTAQGTSCPGVRRASCLTRPTPPLARGGSND